MRHLQVSVDPNPGRDAGLLNLRFLVTSCLVALSFSLLVTSAATGPDFRSFAGTWRGQFKGKTFVTLKLIEHDGKLAGTCVHTTRLEKNLKGELTHVGETQTEDPILEARLKDSRLLISIADNGNVQQPLQCVVRLTGKNEGELQIVSPGDAEWKPWKIKRTASD
jgi:hypothetical protein